MSVRNNILGGTDWSDGEVLEADDLNNTVQENTNISVPIGGVVPWMKDLTGVPALSENFVECNGQTLSDEESPLDGQTIPDLNGSSGENRFLRGNTVSGGTGGSETHNHGGETGPADTEDGFYRQGSVVLTAPDEHTHDISTSNHLPPYHNVVMVMRVK